ncbi:Leucine Rich Repeat family protein [Histomonas meleagridis]|uniref:Leucine Rich Repeat family protein n=1 Tax=Histomonas meleagridis TaxID=135588 RepID=UPI003559FD7D|nr:Leucine Rich Repeat family protein [Histomonas meleagridis]KAH0806935.1 Leucine Rich Repeat family protein [Histomonas meleagridis]
MTKRKSQIATQKAEYSIESEGVTSFSGIKSNNYLRYLKLPKNQISSFDGLNSFPNLKLIDLRGGEYNFTKKEILVAFRNLGISYINGESISSDDYAESFKYSALVTYALRQGMDPILNDDPEQQLKQTLTFLNQPDELPFETDDESVKIKIKGSRYLWYTLDSNFKWKLLEQSSKNKITNSMNFPIKCEVDRTKVYYLPEFDKCYHPYAELTGEPMEGCVLSVSTSLASTINWSVTDYEEDIPNNDTLIFPIIDKYVGKRICCTINYDNSISPTILKTPPIKSGEFRFKSLRLQGQLIEGDEVEFDITTKGTKNAFKGIKILRSARHGEWENVNFIESNGTNNEKLTYKLTIQDIGCVIRAVCITEDNNTPLMLTSNERVQPSLPSFSDAKIYGSFQVGMPLFVVANYKGGNEGNSIYKWSIGKSLHQRYIVPTNDDIGKTISCVLTPIREDGSIGKQIEVTSSNTIQDGNPLQERFLKFHKKTKSGKLQMSFVEKKPSNKLFQIKENESIIISEPYDWVVVNSNGLHVAGTSKVFYAKPEYISGIITLFSNDFFVIVGEVIASTPIASKVSITFDQVSCFLTVSYQYNGGIEGRSIIQWNKIDNYQKETVIGFGKSIRINITDRGCMFKAIVTPISIDGKIGKSISSENFMIEPTMIQNEDKIKLKLTPPKEAIEDIPIKVIEKSKLKNITTNLSIIEVSTTINKRNKIVWKHKNKTFNEGYEYIPNVNDIGKIFNVQIIDRLRSNVITECKLPPIKSGPPTIRNVKLHIKEIPNSDKYRIDVTGEFSGGIEGKSIIIWKIKKPNEEEEIEVARTTQKYVEVDETFEGYLIGVTYIPFNTENKHRGKESSSDYILIPTKEKEKIIHIINTKIVPSNDLTNFICNVKFEGIGNIEYNWGYIVDNERQYIEDTTNIHMITDDDLDFVLFCHVIALDENDEIVDEQFPQITPKETKSKFRCEVYHR